MATGGKWGKGREEFRMMPGLGDWEEGKDQGPGSTRSRHDWQGAWSFGLFRAEQTTPNTQNKQVARS